MNVFTVTFNAFNRSSSLGFYKNMFFYYAFLLKIKLTLNRNVTKMNTSHAVLLQNNTGYFKIICILDFK